jgi:GT2 family glycosyltransferase
MSGDVGLFLDDDVILDRNYVEAILQTYASQPDVGGVAGFVTNVTGPGSTTMFFRRLFLLWHRCGDGRMQKSGHPAYLFDAKGPQQVDVFEGCNMSYRREILHEFRFDEKLSITWSNEDHDFSYRVSRHYKLIQTPFARLKHIHSPIGRMYLAFQWESLIYWHYYFFKKNMPKKWGYVAAYLWSDIGNSCAAIKSCLMNRSSEPMRGILKGYARISRDFFESRIK